MNEDEGYMPEMPAGEEGIPGDHLDEVDDIKATLLQTTWVDEAEQIPLDVLNADERAVIEKCRKREQLTFDEEEQLQMILAQYRPAIQKVEPQQALENAEANQQIISDIDSFLEISEDFNKVQELKFPFNVNGKEIVLHFDVHPLMDSTAILDFNRLSLFQDFTQDEFVLYSKKNRNEPLTREEEAIITHLEERLNRLPEVKQKEILIEFLSMQLTFHAQENTCDEMKKVLKRIPFAYITILFYEVQHMTGLKDVKVEESFQETS